MIPAQLNYSLENLSTRDRQTRGMYRARPLLISSVGDFSTKFQMSENSSSLSDIAKYRGASCSRAHAGRSIAASQSHAQDEMNTNVSLLITRLDDILLHRRVRYINNVTQREPESA